MLGTLASHSITALDMPIVKYKHINKKIVTDVFAYLISNNMPNIKDDLNHIAFVMEQNNKMGRGPFHLLIVVDIYNDLFSIVCNYVDKLIYNWNISYTITSKKLSTFEITESRLRELSVADKDEILLQYNLEQICKYTESDHIFSGFVEHTYASINLGLLDKYKGALLESGIRLYLYCKHIGKYSTTAKMLAHFRDVSDDVYARFLLYCKGLLGTDEITISISPRDCLLMTRHNNFYLQNCSHYELELYNKIYIYLSKPKVCTYLRSLMFDFRKLIKIYSIPLYVSATTKYKSVNSDDTKELEYARYVVDNIDSIKITLSMEDILKDSISVYYMDIISQICA